MSSPPMQRCLEMVMRVFWILSLRHVLAGCIDIFLAFSSFAEKRASLQAAQLWQSSGLFRH